ncbi:MAG: type 1 glutamine amidotransferase domain-containing protein [Tissierellia bacterium]|nr:type 1 glutamine amidotransferase domain-containing protein [Tissierellia bacterium]
MKKIGILIENQFDEQELIYPYHRLRENFEVILIGSKADTEYTSKSGLKFRSDIASSDVNPKEIGGLIIPGGFSPDYMRRCDATIALVKKLNEQNTLIGAICHGPWVLASAIDLKDLDITSFYSIKDDLINAGANWIDKEVVRSQNIITARTPKDLPKFMLKFLSAINFV